MAPRTSSASSRRFASLAALLAIALVTSQAATRPPPAEACGWSEPTMEELTTFDPAVAVEAAGGLQYDPFTEGFGGPCEDCARTAMSADWAGYLGGAVAPADWDPVLRSASARDLEQLRQAAAGKGAAPAGFAAVVRAAKGPAVKPRLVRAIDFVVVARAIEPYASVDATPPAPATAAALARAVDDGLKAARASKDAFLIQRYTFLRLRLAFYLRDWGQTVTVFDRAGAALAGPSADLAVRARYYLAGALRRRGDRARANLELARVHHASPALAAVAAQDFEPLEDKDWKATLALAKSDRERVMLWRLVGLKLDGLAAAQEIARIDPASDQLALLVVRELARIESTAKGVWGSPDPAALAASQKAAAALEQLATGLAGNPRADRPWLMELVAGHLAARRGDLGTARTRLGAAARARAGDARVAAQAQASLAMAIAQSGPLDPARAEELARTMTALDPSFARATTLTFEVRARLAAEALRAGNPVDAELLTPGSAGPAVWRDVGFLGKIIARTGQKASAYDRFVLTGTHTRGQLEQELALRHLLDGNFVAAHKQFASGRADASPLGTDPFVTHIVDCHDCDHATYGNAPWTHATFAARLAELARKAGGKGSAASDAALALGTAMYNVTWYGNARSVLGGSHQATRDTSAALRWYQKAYQLAPDRERKARAAFYAAKAEMAQLITARYDVYESAEVLPVPTTWYPVVKSLADTRYYQEVLRECGTFAAWARGPLP